MSKKEPWEKWDTPWTKQQIKMRYVQGDTIGIRPLSKVSGVSKGTIEDWCRKEKWPEQRRQYQDRVETATTEKAIEKISEQNSDELSKLATEHFQANKIFRNLAQVIAQAELKKIATAKTKGEEAYNKAIEEAKYSAKAMSLWSQILDRALAGESAATGLKYHVDINAAVERLEKEGFEIYDPAETEAQTED